LISKSHRAGADLDAGADNQPAERQSRKERAMENEEGYPAIFYVMLILGIVGVIGFLVTAAGAAGGM
jgi:hypothetical protein